MGEDTVNSVDEDIDEDRISNAVRQVGSYCSHNLTVVDDSGRVSTKKKTIMRFHLATDRTKRTFSRIPTM